MIEKDYCRGRRTLQNSLKIILEFRTDLLKFLSYPHKMLTNPLFFWKAAIVDSSHLLNSTYHLPKLSPQSESDANYVLPLAILFPIG
jgi:hypothetical protein